MIRSIHEATCPATVERQGAWRLCSAVHRPHMLPPPNTALETPQRLVMLPGHSHTPYALPPQLLHTASGLAMSLLEQEKPPHHYISPELSTITQHTRGLLQTGLFKSR